MRKLLGIVILVVAGTLALSAQSSREAWRVATEPELKSLIPARAPVVHERIETEMRTASGITDGKGKFIAGVVLITAGYSADGKYSHLFITQVPVKIDEFQLTPGSYLIGWDREENAIKVHFYDASSGLLLGSVEAPRNPSITRVESFRIWPPDDRSVVQIGRFTFPYAIGE